MSDKRCPYFCKDEGCVVCDSVCFSDVYTQCYSFWYRKLGEEKEKNEKLKIKINHLSEDLRQSAEQVKSNYADANRMESLRIREIEIMEDAYKTQLEIKERIRQLVKYWNIRPEDAGYYMSEIEQLIAK